MAKYTIELFIVEDLSACSVMVKFESRKKVEFEQECIGWLKGVCTTDKSIALFKFEEGKRLEQCLAWAAILHQKNLHCAKTTDDAMSRKCNQCMQGGSRVSFDGLAIDTSANCTSVISVGQCRAYCWKFNQTHKTSPQWASRSLGRGGGVSYAVGVVVSPFLFQETERSDRCFISGVATYYSHTSLRERYIWNWFGYFYSRLLRWLGKQTSPFLT